MPGQCYANELAMFLENIVRNKLIRTSAPMSTVITPAPLKLDQSTRSQFDEGVYLI